MRHQAWASDATGEFPLQFNAPRDLFHQFCKFISLTGDSLSCSSPSYHSRHPSHNQCPSETEHEAAVRITIGDWIWLLEWRFGEQGCGQGQDLFHLQIWQQQQLSHLLKWMWTGSRRDLPTGGWAGLFMFYVVLRIRRTTENCAPLLMSSTLLGQRLKLQAKFTFEHICQRLRCKKRFFFFKFRVLIWSKHAC